jgi:hypothetical protein
MQVAFFYLSNFLQQIDVLANITIVIIHCYQLIRGCGTRLWHSLALVSSILRFGSPSEEDDDNIGCVININIIITIIYFIFSW